MKKTLRLDLHIHTNFSDGTASPEDVVKHAARIGLHGIAITDHDNMDALKEAIPVAEKEKIILIPAAEITTPGGDILALGIEKIPKGDVKQIIKEIHKQGGIAVLAHPYGGYWEDPIPNHPDIVKEFDAIEIFNASTPLERNLEAMDLAKKMMMPGIAASDAHFLEAIGSAFVEVEAKSEKEILEKIKKGELKIGWI